MKARQIIDAGDEIAEAPRWDTDGGRLVWVDHGGDAVHTAVDRDGWREQSRWMVGQRVAAAIPRRDGGIVVIAGADVLLLDEASGTVDPIARLGIDPRRDRANDATCDASGRLWVTTFTDTLDPARGGLHRVDPDGSTSEVLNDIALGNGLDFSADGRTLYLADSVRMTVEALAVDDGMVRGRRTLLSFTASEGAPNGVVVDADDNAWVALTGAGRVAAHSSDGRAQLTVDVGVPGVTACTFGGPDGDILFVTTRRGRLPAFAAGLGFTERMMDCTVPGSGTLFACRPGARAAPARRFAG